jgi:hypothetical protein
MEEHEGFGNMGVFGFITLFIIACVKMAVGIAMWKTRF